MLYDIVKVGNIIWFTGGDSLYWGVESGLEDRIVFIGGVGEYTLDVAAGARRCVAVDRLHPGDAAIYYVTRHFLHLLA